MPPRPRYLCRIVACLAGLLGLFYVSWGAATGGSWGVLFWPSLAMMALYVVLIAAFCAIRAGELGLHRGIAFLLGLFAPLAVPFGPAGLLILGVMPQAPGAARPGRIEDWLWPPLLLVAPWIMVAVLKPTPYSG